MPVGAPPEPGCVPPEPPSPECEVEVVQAANEGRESENKARLSEARFIQISSSTNNQKAAVVELRRGDRARR
jgi:hypothetical protein